MHAVENAKAEQRGAHEEAGEAQQIATAVTVHQPDADDRDENLKRTFRIYGSGPEGSFCNK